MTKVTHPLADRDAPVPAAVAGPDGGNISVGDDGTVTVSDSDAAALADAWAAKYDVDRDSLLTNTEADSGDVLVNDLAQLTYDELYAKAQERDIDGRSGMDSDELVAALQGHDDEEPEE